MVLVTSVAPTTATIQKEEETREPAYTEEEIHGPSRGAARRARPTRV